MAKHCRDDLHQCHCDRDQQTEAGGGVLEVVEASSKINSPRRSESCSKKRSPGDKSTRREITRAEEQGEDTRQAQKEQLNRDAGSIAEHVQRQQKALAPAVQLRLSNPVAPGIPASRASSPDVRAAIRRVWIEEVNGKSKSTPMRHAKMDMTHYYSHSRRKAKRAAQERVLQHLIPAEMRMPMRVRETIQ